MSIASSSDTAMSGWNGKSGIATTVAIALLSTTAVAALKLTSKTSKTTTSKTAAVVVIPTAQAKTVNTLAAAMSSTALSATGRDYSLSDYLWKGASSAGDDDQGKFLDQVAQQMNAAGTAGVASALKAPALSVSADKRSLVTQAGKPFYWLSDTSWMWMYRLTASERADYARVRAAQGFNVLLFQMLTGGYGQTDTDGKAMFNARGLTYGPALTRAPNVQFWANARRAVEDISRAGIVPAMVLAWGAHVRKGLFDEQSAYAYGRLIGRTFGDLNMIFVLGGDINPTAAEKPIWDAMARGIRAGEPRRNLISFHPASGSATDYFPNADWLDIDGMQTGHGRWRPRANGIGTAISNRYFENRNRPLVDFESGYERIVDNLYKAEPNTAAFVSDDKRLDAYDIRVRAYQEWLSGAMGYGYGELDTVIAWSQGYAPMWPVNLNWRDALGIEGAAQMKYFQAVRLEAGQATMAPVAEWSELNANIQDYYRTLTACNSAQSVCVSYDTDGTPVSLPITKSQFRTCVWMDPRTGKRSACTGTPVTKGTGMTYVPPVVLNTPVMLNGTYVRNNNDWVLILKK